MSLLDAAERFAAMDRSAVTLDTACCLHSQDRNSVCEACFTICPTGAIVPGKPPVFDAAKCDGCLACLTLCPTGAFSADDAVPSLLRSVSQLESHSLELLCASNPVPEKGISEASTGIVVKGCLAGLGAGTYIALGAFGLERIAPRTEACAGCQWAALVPEIEAQIGRAQHFLAGWGKSGILAPVAVTDEMTTRPLWSAENPPLSRRDLFRMMAHQGQVAMARAMENGPHQTGRRPGRDRLRTLGAVKSMPAPEYESSIDLNEFDFASLTVTEACTACGACARACPTEALSFEKDEDGTRFALKFLPGNCIACDLCARVCMPNAVSINNKPVFGETFTAEPVTLQEGELVKCRRCGALVAKREGAELCDLCEYRSTHPFGSVMPPGWSGSPFGRVEQKQ